MKTHRLGKSFAVEIRGVDLGGDLSQGTLDAVRDAWLDNGVAVFPDQSLDDDALVAFTRRLGPLVVHVRAQFHSRDRPEVMMISNVDEPGREYSALGDGELSWHTDQAYTAQPAFGTLLYALEIPNSGGDTEFCDLAAAYREMPRGLAHRAGQRRIAYSIDASSRTQGICATPAQRQAAPDMSHPIVRQHPLREDIRALYVSPAHALGVAPPGQGADAELLDDLVAWITRFAFRYTHRWRVGDVVIWDNTRTVHRRIGFPSDQRRILKRTGFMLPGNLARPY